MKKKNKTVLFIVTNLIFLIFLFLPSILFAQVYDNIGFKKDVPEEIRKACPMCDEFLDVKWIDKKRNVGKLKAEVYEDGKKRSIVHLLVILKEPMSNEMAIRGDFVFYRIKQQDYYSEGFDKFLKTSTFNYHGGANFMFKVFVRGDKERIFTLFKITGIPSVLNYQLSFSEFKKSICILYPDEKAIFIVEAKRPFWKENLSGNLRHDFDLILKFTNDKCREMNETMSALKKERYKCLNTKLDIRHTESLDIDFDEFVEYFFELDPSNIPHDWKERSFMYVQKNGKSEFINITKCFYTKELLFSKVLYYMIDQKTFYLGNCNLTTLLKGGN